MEVTSGHLPDRRANSDSRPTPSLPAVGAPRLTTYFSPTRSFPSRVRLVWPSSGFWRWALFSAAGDDRPFNCDRLRLKRKHSLHFVLAADDERRALVHGFRLLFQNAFLAVGGDAAGLFGHEGQRVCLIEQSQLAVRRFL